MTTFVLGINDGHNASSCLLKNGKIVACAAEERFTRRKNQTGFPAHSIQYCLEEGKISTHDVELVALASRTTGWRPTSAPGSAYYEALLKVENQMSRVKLLADVVHKSIAPFLNLRVAKHRVARLFMQTGIEPSKVVLVDHHLAHACTALYESPYPSGGRDVLVLTNDGMGDHICATVSKFEDGRLKTLSRTYLSNSIGLLYSEVTKYLGMKVAEDEHKVMGLAGYASRPRNSLAYRFLIRDFTVLPNLEFYCSQSSRRYSAYVSKILRSARFDNIAGAVQAFLEDILMAWVKRAVERTRLPNIVASGGTFLNVKANMRIASLENIQHFYVAPSPGDESNAVGAAYAAYLMQNENAKIEPIRDVYWGPQFGDDAIGRELENRPDLEVMRVSDNEISSEIASLLQRGEVVARFSGRMEFGARALGNRSILANPSDSSVVKEINTQIKSRDFWMPFAPTILRGSENRYISSPTPDKVNDQYMIFAFQSSEEALRDIPATLHAYDGTLRPQVLDKEWNPGYYELIQHFGEKTGTFALLNTSFNLHGQPIVCSPKDAVETMFNSGLRFLAIGNCLVSKRT